MVVTGIHNHVGNVADVIIDPSICTGKIRPGKEIADVQAAFQMLNVGLATAPKVPKLMTNDVKHLLLDDRAMNVWSSFQADLRTFEEELKGRNAIRGNFALNSFLPSRLTISVSI